MKTAAISLLFAGYALAIPAVREQKRALVTDVIVETVWTTTTVFVSATNAAKANFAEGKASSSAPAVVSSIATPAPSVAPVVAAVAAPAPSAAPAPPVVAAAPVVAAVVPASGSGPSGTGEATWYDVSVGKGSCGTQASNSDPVVALAIPKMANGANPNSNPLCGKPITITYNGATHVGRVYDTCEGCAAGNIDLSPEFFKTVFPSGDGRVSGVSWVVG